MGHMAVRNGLHAGLTAGLTARLTAGLTALTTSFPWGQLITKNEAVHPSPHRLFSNLNHLHLFKKKTQIPLSQGGRLEHEYYKRFHDECSVVSRFGETGSGLPLRFRDHVRVRFWENL